MKKRRQKRTKMVLPVRIVARDIHNTPFEALAHTLDIAPNGARLGAVRQVLNVGDTLMLQYRQRKIHFRVMWVRLLEGTTEYQVGVQTVSQGGETWGLELPTDAEEAPAPLPICANMSGQTAAAAAIA